MQPGRPPVECVERIGPRPSRGSRDHPIGKAGIALTVASGGSEDIVHRLDAQFGSRGKGFENRGEPVAGKPVGPLQYPAEFHDDFPAHETGPIGGKSGHKAASCLSLPCIVVDQVAHQDIGIERDH